ncbi:jg1468, partial [Pararge aegeria aegeria]
NHCISISGEVFAENRDDFGFAEQQRFSKLVSRKSALRTDEQNTSASPIDS